MKTIASHPGAGTFRTTVVIILIVIFIGVFLISTARLNHEAEAVARDQVITDLKLAMTMMLYDYTIKGQSDDLDKFDLENPFVPLGIYRSLPQTYRGTVSHKREIAANGWYFDLSRRRAIYRFNDVDVPDEEFVMRWVFDDFDNDGLQDSSEPGYLKLERA